jgi:predicted Holliday junction resolvase-like endonuclease
MNNIIDSLWYWTYGIIVGWGASFTITIAVIIVLFIKLLHLKQRIIRLENRIVCNERELSFHINNDTR